MLRGLKKNLKLKTIIPKSITKLLSSVFLIDQLKLSCYLFQILYKKKNFNPSCIKV